MVQIKRPFTVSAMTLLFSYFLLMAEADTALAICLTAVSALFLFFVLRKSVISRVLLLIAAFITTATVSFSVAEALRERENLLAGFNKEICGTVTDISFYEDKSTRSVTLSDCTVDNTKILSEITLYPNNNTDFSYGDRLSFTATRLQTAENNGIYRFHSLSDRSHLSCYNKTGEYSVEKAEKSLYFSILSLRELASEKLSSALSKNSFAISQALFTGSKDALSPSLSAGLRICEVSHIFAVSGMHLSLWTGLFFIILKRKAENSIIPNILAALFVIFYIVFTGFSPSVLRAGIMLLTVFAGRLIKRASDTLNSLGLSGTLLMTINPYLAGNVSFLLSFTATGAIALWSEFIFPEKKIPDRNYRRIKMRLKQPLYDISVSVAVILTTLPVVSLFFGYFSLISPVASLIVTPLAQAVMLLCAPLVLLPQGNFLYDIFSGLSEAACSIMTNIVMKLSEADFLLIPAEFSILLPIFLLTALVCGIFIIFRKDQKKALASIIAGTLVFSLLTAVNLYSHKDETEVMIFGGENATLISVSDNFSHSAVIGSGGSYSLVSQLSAYLQRKAIVKTELLLIPRNTETENKNTDYIRKYFSAENTIKLYNEEKAVNTSLWSENRITGFTDEDFSAAALYIDDIKIVICSLPSSDFTEENTEFMSGDILICRSNIPENLERDSFSDVIIVTDCERSYPFPFISAKDGNVKITVKGDSYAIH